MTEFRNPYHFVPLGSGSPPDTVPVADLRGREPGTPRQAPHLTHDRFLRDTHSGRLVCKLTVETPLLCGNEQEPQTGWTKLIKPFELELGQPALPGSALRGMLSTLVEAASHSAFRVLENRRMSYRRPLRDALSAIGMVVAGPGGSLGLFPLASPHEDSRGAKLPQRGNASYAGMFPQRRPKVYFGDQAGITRDTFHRKYLSNSSPTGGPFYGVRDGLDDKVTDDGFWLGEVIRRPRDSKVPQPCVVPWGEVPESERRNGQWVRGILRVLGRYESRKDALTPKKHEYFLRFSEQDEADLIAGRARVFPIARDAITRFNELADERAAAENDDSTPAEKLLPFTPNGASRGDLRGAGRVATSWQLKPGDLVFFLPSSDGSTVVEVSLSSGWRGRVEQSSPRLSAGAPLWDFLPPELRPLTDERRSLTLAEQLFGVVAEREKGRGPVTDEPAFALAGRVRVSHGLLHSAPQGGPYLSVRDELLSAGHRSALEAAGVSHVPLKNLASPKPPSPALYFKGINGRGVYISKQELNPKHQLQGRKLYLRRHDARFEPIEAFVHPQRLRDAANDRQGRAAIARQHQSVEKLVRRGTTFFFHLDFDNLSSLELQLVVYALQPSPGFRHQLGHGKPLGLGQNLIEVAGLLEVHRWTRYGKDGLRASRWHDAWATGNPHQDWPEPLRRHLPDSGAFEALREKLAALRKSFEAWAESKELTPVLRALELLGTPPADAIPTHYPQVDGIAEGSGSFEQEHYRWFVQNDDTRRRRTPGQFLMPLIDADGSPLPSLPTLERQQSESPPSTRRVGSPPSDPPRSGRPPQARDAQRAAPSQGDRSRQLAAGARLRCTVTGDKTRKGGPFLLVVGSTQRCVLHPQSAPLPDFPKGTEIDVVLRATGDTWQVEWKPT